MGLDITHFKLSPVKTESGQLFLKDEIELAMRGKNCLNEDVYTESLVEGYWELVAVFENETDLREAENGLKELNDGYRHFKLLVSKEDEMYSEKVERFEQDYGISGFDKTESIEKLESKEGREIQFKSLCYKGVRNCQVTYAESIGYQRKGMGAGFSDFFMNDSFYSERSYFEKLEEFSSPENHMYEEDNIENGFIRNYSPGESLMMISW